ncbi:hypothetical protein [Marinifilum sp.]|uniref:hypothetical protein n=1 Tax=Marinifilum sp. TaxID=2033137 RepID=UPI003BAC0F15
MKKRGIAKSKIQIGINGKVEKACKKLRISIQQFVIAFVLAVCILPLSNEVLASDKKIKPGKRQATLILSDGRKIVLNTSSDTIVNSQTKGVRIVVDSTGINYITTRDEEKVETVKKSTVAKKK